MGAGVEEEVEFWENHVNAFVACCYARAGDDQQSRNETENLLRMQRLLLTPPEAAGVDMTGGPGEEETGE